MAFTFEIFRDRNGKFGWRFKAANGETIASSTSTYETKAGALRSTEQVRTGAAGAQVRDLA